MFFTSSASNLVTGDTNDDLDVFVHDRQTGVTSVVTVGTGGSPAGGVSDDDSASISADGRYVAFTSSASNLVDGEDIVWNEVFVARIW